MMYWAEFTFPPINLWNAPPSPEMTALHLNRFPVMDEISKQDNPHNQEKNDD